MNATPAIENMSREDWVTANQRALMAELGRVHKALTARLPESESNPSAESPAGADRTCLPELGVRENRRSIPAPPELPLLAGVPPSALDVVVTAFGLSAFERDLLLLCAGPDLDAKFGTLVARLQNNPRHTAPTFSLALAVLPDAHWSALSPAAPLRRWRLVELGVGDSLTSSPLRIDEWLLHFLAGTPYLDERLQSLLRPVATVVAAAPTQRFAAERVARHWQGAFRENATPVVELCGDSLDDQVAVAALAGALLKCRLFRLPAADAAATPTERETLARLWEREAAVNGSVLMVDFHETDPAETPRAALALLEAVNAPLVVLTREPLRGSGRGRVRFEVARLSSREQQSLWRDALGGLAHSLNGQIEAVAGQFHFSAREIHRAAATLCADGRGWQSPPVTSAPDAHEAEDGTRNLLWNLCRTQSRARLESLAQRLDPVATWDDLILPPEQKGALRDIARHVRQRFRVYEEWGFAAKGARGLGISALFTGASGTGKTMAAEVLANDLNLDVFRIDLSAVVSKYIGETEKNLRRIFDAAEVGGAILLFDEADALFGKRSEVKDSHDRYANIEVSYLLQRMESYRGLAILTTNFKQALDAAFLRRLRFVVPFPFPDASQRAEIWRRIFPAETPTDRLDVCKLARLNVAGGNIRNIALNAAFLAAEAGVPVRMEHLVAAARSECAKLERPSSEAELGGWT